MGDCALFHISWERQSPSGDSPLSGTQGTSRTTPHSNMWSSGCSTGLKTSQNQVLENEDLIEEKSYNSRNPFNVSSKLSLARMQKWDLQLLSLGFTLVSDAQNACYYHQGNKKKLTEFIWNSQVLSTDIHLNQLLRTLNFPLDVNERKHWEIIIHVQVHCKMQHRKFSFQFKLHL